MHALLEPCENSEHKSQDSQKNHKECRKDSGVDEMEEEEVHLEPARLDGPGLYRLVKAVAEIAVLADATFDIKADAWDDTSHDD